MPVAMNEVARPGAVRLVRSKATSFTITAAIHHPPHSQAVRRPVRAAVTITTTAITVHSTDSDAPKAVESISASGSHGTSHQWWIVRASSMVATAMPPAPAARAPAARAPTGEPSPGEDSRSSGRTAAIHRTPSTASTASSTISGFSTGTKGRGDGSPSDTRLAAATTVAASSSAGPAHASRYTRRWACTGHRSQRPPGSAAAASAVPAAAGATISQTPSAARSVCQYTSVTARSTSSQ